MMLGRWQGLRKAGVLGLNARNGDYISQVNRRRFFPLVDDKVLCKQRLQREGLPVPKMIGLARYMHEAAHIEELLGDHTEFVIKPAHGSGGDGILVITGRQPGFYIDSDGHLLSHEFLVHHLTNVLGGLYSLGGQPDAALIETLVHFDHAFSRLTYHGVPDIRVIVYRGYPVMAMTRLPTRRSHGKANLHQGAIGAGINLATGLTFGGVLGNSAVSVHPDTGASVEGFEVPAWTQILDMSARGFEAVELGYIGVDIVLDRDLGPLILELNARPGLNIQIANRQGLHHRLRAVDQETRPGEAPQQRVAWSRTRFSP
jgi:alpha-L-glutamate ligase-like protein